MGEFVQLIVSGIATGAIYALAALGLHAAVAGGRRDQFRAGRVRDAAGVRMLVCIAARHAAVARVPAHLRGRRCWCSASRSSACIVDPLIRHGVIPLVIATLGLSIGLKSIVQGRLQRRGAPVPEPVSRRAVRRWPASTISYADVGTLVIAGVIVFGAADVPQQDRHRPRDAGGRAEHRRGEGARASTCGGWCCTCS